MAAAVSLTPRSAENVGHAIFNILENAIVAASSRVSVDASLAGDELVVAVVDDGPGMPVLLLERAMEPFVTTKPEGTGMGLAIASAAAREEGGRVSLVNQESRGLRVEFVVPLRRGPADGARGRPDPGAAMT
jgi:signal transduction histidine kinase